MTLKKYPPTMSQWTTLLYPLLEANSQALLKSCNLLLEQNMKLTHLKRYPLPSRSTSGSKTSIMNGNNSKTGNSSNSNNKPGNSNNRTGNKTNLIQGIYLTNNPRTIFTSLISLRVIIISKSKQLMNLIKLSNHMHHSSLIQDPSMQDLNSPLGL